MTSQTPLAELLGRLGTRERVAELTGASVSSVRRWANGHGQPDKANLVRLLVVANERFGLSMTPEVLDDLIAGRTSLGELQQSRQAHHDADGWAAAAEAAAGAVDMTTQLTSRLVPDEALDMYYRTLIRLATEFVHQPAERWFKPLTVLWAQLRAVLEAGPHPRQTKDLYLLGGMTSVVLAHGCHVVGSSDNGLVLARTAETLAKAIGHPELQAWALGTRGLITDSLPTRSPIDASPLTLVAEAQSLVGSSTGTVVARLFSYQSRFAAHVGAVEDARHAQIDAMYARDRIGDGRGDLDAVGGILHFGDAKQQALDAGIYFTCGSYELAERAANEAIIAYERGPAHERSRGDVAIAYLDRAAAQAALGRVDDAAASARPVLDLADADLIAPMEPALRRLADHLGAPRLRGRTSAELRAEITEIGGFRALPAGTIPA
jgi:transcriptional regulator with XRE-family HTH domain